MFFATALWSRSSLMPVKSLREHKAAASCTHLHTVRAPSKHLVQRDADDLGVAVCRSESTHRILMWCGVSAHRRGMRRDTDVGDKALCRCEAWTHTESQTKTFIHIRSLCREKRSAKSCRTVVWSFASTALLILPPADSSLTFFSFGDNSLALCRMGEKRCRSDSGQ